jgi:hypothetical protein
LLALFLKLKVILLQAELVKLGSEPRDLVLGCVFHPFFHALERKHHRRKQQRKGGPQ